MKIAMLGSKGIPATWGGIEHHVQELSTRMVEMGHDVTVYCRPYYTTTNKTHYKGVRLRKLPTVPTKSLDAIVATFFATVDSIAERYDILHFHAIGPATMSVISRMAGENTVVTVHGLDWQREKWGKPAKLYLKFGEWASMMFPYNKIAVSKFLKKHLEDKYGRPVMYIPSATTDPVFLEPNQIKQYGLQGKDYILFLARLVPEKGAHFLIDAYKKLDTDLKLVIAGGSSHSDEYVTDLQRSAPENVIFTGNVYGDVKHELYSNAYCYVQPSTIEGLPITLIEAVAYGNCIIASSIPACMEVVEESGLIFETENVDALAAVLQKVIAAPDLARELGEKAKARGVSEYNYDRVAEQTIEVYKSVLAQRDKRCPPVGRDFGDAAEASALAECRPF